MEPGEDRRTAPTWQWVASGAISLLLFFSSVILLETRGDIKDLRRDTTEVTKKVAVIEIGAQMQFEAVKAWREEIKTNLEHIMAVQEKTNGKLDKSAVTLKEWKGR